MLTFILKKEWYEKIKSGCKKVEYREVKPYWTARLKNAVDNIFPVVFLDSLKNTEIISNMIRNQNCSAISSLDINPESGLKPASQKLRSEMD